MQGGKDKSKMDNNTIRRIAMEQSAYECNCTWEDFLSDENNVHLSVATDKARKYLELPHICNFVSYGTNIVAAGQEELLPEMEQFLHSVTDIEKCFETPVLYLINKILEKADGRICFMADYFLPDLDQVFRLDLPCTYELKVMEAAEFEELYIPEWKNALCADRKHLDRLGVGAFDQGKLVGLAGCSADCDTMWQIGVDVLPEYRRKGIASALTNRLARETFDRGYIPFYCAAWSNVKSVKNAIRSGFRPGWVEATAKRNDFISAINEPSAVFAAGDLTLTAQRSK